MQGVFHAVGQDYESQGPARGLRLAVLDSGSEVLEVSAHGHSNTLWARTTTSGIPPVVSNSSHSTEAAKVQAVHAQSLSNTMYAMAARGALARGVFDSLCCTDAAKVPDVYAQGFSHTLYAMAALGWILPEVFRLAELHRGSEGAGRQRAGFPPHALCGGCARQVSLEGINWVSYADAAMVQDVNAQSLAHTMCAMAALGACARRFRFEVLHRCREGARRQRAGPLPHAVRYGCVRQGPA